jgi:hypothetical protein
MLATAGLYVSYSNNTAGKSLARPTSRCILFVGEDISFDASLVLYIYIYIYIYMYSTNISSPGVKAAGA